MKIYRNFLIYLGKFENIKGFVANTFQVFEDKILETICYIFAFLPHRQSQHPLCGIFYGEFVRQNPFIVVLQGFVGNTLCNGKFD